MNTKHTITILLALATFASAGTSKPATQPKILKTLNDFFCIVPANLQPGPHGEWTKLKQEACNDKLAENKNKTAEMRVTIADVGAITNDQIQVTTIVPKVGNIEVGLYLYFDSSVKDELAGLKRGDTITIRGICKRCDFPRASKVYIDLKLCELVTETAKN